MGSFKGHAFPGAMFIVFGVWWTLRIAQIRAESFFNGRRGIGSRRSIRFIFPCRCVPGIPLEAIVKVILSFCGIVLETRAAVVGQDVADAADMQHVTMYSMFLVSGFVDILTFYRALIPLGVDYFFGIMSFGIEGFLFWYHIEHQSSFEQMVHIMLIVAICGCIIGTLLEAYNSDSLELKYLRAFFVLLQGTWFFQADAEKSDYKGMEEKTYLIAEEEACA